MPSVHHRGGLSSSPRARLWLGCGACGGLLKMSGTLSRPAGAPTRTADPGRAEHGAWGWNPAWSHAVTRGNQTTFSASTQPRPWQELSEQFTCNSRRGATRHRAQCATTSLTCSTRAEGLIACALMPPIVRTRRSGVCALPSGEGVKAPVDAGQTSMYAPESAPRQAADLLQLLCSDSDAETRSLIDSARAMIDIWVASSIGRAFG